MRFGRREVVVRLMELTGAAYMVREREREQGRRERLRRLAAALSRRMPAPRCPRCGNATDLRGGRYGPFYGCPDRECGGRVGVPRRLVELALEELREMCPECERGKVVLKWGKNGAFLGCGLWPECKWSDSF